MILMMGNMSFYIKHALLSFLMFALFLHDENEKLKNK